MTFELPEPRESTAAKLRELEANAPAPCPKNIRAAMTQAAQELEAWKSLSEQLVPQLHEVANRRLSVMASTSMVEESQRGIRSTLLEAARRLQDMP